MADQILEVRDLVIRFNSFQAINGLEFRVTVPREGAGVRHVIIGPNGAGKTTLFDAITGAVAPAGGAIAFHGQRIDRLSIAHRARLGIVRTFQHSRVFTSLSVLENIWVGANQHDATYRFWTGWRRNRRALADAQNIAQLLGLDPLAHKEAGVLSHGQRRVLEIGMALAAKPRLLLLDEPTAGLSRPERERVVQSVTDLSTTCPVVAIEHDLDIVFTFATWITVLHHGKLLRDGPPEVIARDDAVDAAYLGERGVSDVAAG